MLIENKVRIPEWRISKRRNDTPIVIEIGEFLLFRNDVIWASNYLDFFKYIGVV